MRPAPAVPRLRHKVVGILRGKRAERDQLIADLAASLVLARNGIHPSKRPANRGA